MPHVKATHIAINKFRNGAIYVVISNKQVFHCTENESGLIPLSDPNNWTYETVDADYFRSLIEKDKQSERKWIFEKLADVEECLSIKKFFKGQIDRKRIYGGIN